MVFYINFAVFESNFHHIFDAKKIGQYDIPRVLGFEPVDGVLVVLSSNQLHIVVFVHQMGDVCVCSPDGRCVCLPSGEQKWQYLFDLN